MTSNQQPYLYQHPAAVGVSIDWSQVLTNINIDQNVDTGQEPELVSVSRLWTYPQCQSLDTDTPLEIPQDDSSTLVNFEDGNESVQVITAPLSKLVANSPISAAREEILQIIENIGSSGESILELNDSTAVVDRQSSSSSKKVACSICCKEFKSSSGLRRHRISHSENSQPYSCEICDKRFTQSSTLATHRREIHHQGVRNLFECEICHRKFSRRFSVKAHFKSCHTKTASRTLGIEPGEIQIPPPPPSDPGNSDKSEDKWNCKECPLCHRTFTQARHCKRHMSIHTGERQLKCHHCDKTFYRKDDLIKHIKAHFNIKKYASSFCSRRFRHLRNLKHHEKMHVDQGICYTDYERKIRRCSICLEPAATAVLYTMHFMDKHNRECVVELSRVTIQTINTAPQDFEDTNPGIISSSVLCTICGSHFSESDYKLHRILCEMSIECEGELNVSTAGHDRTLISESNETQIDDADMQPNNNDINDLNYQFEKNQEIPTSNASNDVELWVWDYSFNITNIEEDLLETETSETTAIWLLKHKSNDNSTIITSPNPKQPIETLEKSFSVHVNKMMFKPLLSLAHRGICEVKACADTLHTPWYMCAKCGRTYSVKTKARQHKIHSCISKHKFNVVVRERLCETKNTADQSGTAAEVVVGAKQFASRDEHWTENWAEDLVPDYTVERQRSIKVNDGGKAKCLICGKTFNSEKRARVHMTVHKDKKHVCEHCGKAFRWRDIYTAHIRIHTGVKPYKCRSCGKPFRNIVGRHMHEKTHIPQAERLKAKQLRETDGTAKEKIKFPCTECSAALVNKQSLQRHMAKIHPKEGTSIHSVVCDQCPQVLQDQFGLRRHKLVMHSQNGIKPKFFNCKVCQEGFSLLRTIKRHVRIQHEDILPHPLRTSDQAVADGNIKLSIEDYFIRKKSVRL